MKKLIALLTVFVLAVTMLVGCGGGGEGAGKGTIEVVAKGESHAFWQ